MELDNQQGLGIEFERQDARRRVLVVLDDAKLDIIALGMEGDEDVNSGAQWTEDGGDAVLAVERSVRLFERGAEPHLEPDPACNSRNFPMSSQVDLVKS